MAQVTILPHGMTAAIVSDHVRSPGIKQSVAGWSQSSTRSNVRFLRSVLVDDLTGIGLTFTLTVRDTPSSADDWHKVRRAFIERLRRMGLIRLHWLTEWQRRGAPHLHGMAYFPEPPDGSRLPDLVGAWLGAAGQYGPAFHCQTVRPIFDQVGWHKYLAKHSARGLHHYQRASTTIPKGWKSKTGRMWGKIGGWPTGPEILADIPLNQFYWVRRIYKRWRLADARSSRTGPARTRGILSARGYLQAPEKLSRVIGLSEWDDLDPYAVLEASAVLSLARDRKSVV